MKCGDFVMTNSLAAAEYLLEKYNRMDLFGKLFNLFRNNLRIKDSNPFFHLFSKYYHWCFVIGM